MGWETAMPDNDCLQGSGHALYLSGLPSLLHYPQGGAEHYLHMGVNFLRLNLVVSLMKSLWWLLLPSLCILDSTTKSFCPLFSCPPWICGFLLVSLQIPGNTHQGPGAPQQKTEHDSLNTSTAETHPGCGSGDTPNPYANQDA